jgi:hypothetical protein
MRELAFQPQRRAFWDRDNRRPVERAFIGVGEVDVGIGVVRSAIPEAAACVGLCGKAKANPNAAATAKKRPIISPSILWPASFNNRTLFASRTGH